MYGERGTIMKKIAYSVNGTTQNIYSGIERVYGGWIATTEGNPVALNELEDAGDEDEIIRIDFLIEENDGEELTKEDIEYINEWLEIWGC